LLFYIKNSYFNIIVPQIVHRILALPKKYIIFAGKF
jgi:hypothetical protein